MDLSEHLDVAGILQRPRQTRLTLLRLKNRRQRNPKYTPILLSSPSAMRHVVVVSIPALRKTIHSVYGTFSNAPSVRAPGVYKRVGLGGRDAVILPEVWAKFLVEELFCRKSTKNSLLFQMPSTVPDVCFQIEGETYHFEICQGTGAELGCLHIEAIWVTPSTSQIPIRLTKTHWRASGLGRWVPKEAKCESPVVARVLQQWRDAVLLHAAPKKRFFPFGTYGMTSTQSVRRSLKRKRPIKVHNPVAIDEAREEPRVFAAKFVDAFRPRINLIPPTGSSWWDESARRVVILGCGRGRSEEDKQRLLKYVQKRLLPTKVIHYEQKEDGRCQLPPGLETEPSARVMTLGRVPARVERELLQRIAGVV